MSGVLICPRCEGDGVLELGTCPDCNGAGVISPTRLAILDAHHALERREDPAKRWCDAMECWECGAGEGDTCRGWCPTGGWRERVAHDPQPPARSIL